MSTYLSEFSRHWRGLLAASVGIAGGTISNYINNLFTPSLVEEFGWSRSQFALVGLAVIISAVCLPLAGRMIDHFGTRRMAISGVVGLPAVFVGLSLMNGDFRVFFALTVLQILFVSCIAGSMVYARLITGSFTLARGVALGLASCAPPLATVVFSPLLAAFIESDGWRAGYLVMAAFTGICGVTAILVMPRIMDGRTARTAEARPKGRYGDIIKSRTFQIFFVALVLCNLHFTVLTTQLSVVVQERGVDAATAALMLSLYASGVIAGRVLCGVALDRFPTHLVCAASFAIPAIGLALLATGVHSNLIVALGVASLGFAMGAEGDLIVYLAAKYFPASFFSSILGLFTSAMAFSATGGALMLSIMLARFGSYSPFLGLTAATMAVGAILFLLTPKVVRRDASSSELSPDG
ncbi:Major Facilitator Superfamily protein [compost metagenome]